MSIPPFLLDCEYLHPHSAQDFWMPLTPDDFLLSDAPVISRDYYRPWHHQAVIRDLGSYVKNDREKFQITLDVQHFGPEDISVKTAEGYIIIEGQHEEKQDEHGFISRKFTRKYVLPDTCDPETVRSCLSSDEVLTVTALKKSVAFYYERVVPVVQSGPIREKNKDQDCQTNADDE